MVTIGIVKYYRDTRTADAAASSNSTKPRAEVEESDDVYSSNKRPPPYSRQGRRAKLQAVAAASAFSSKAPVSTAFVVEPGGDINAWQKKGDFVITNREFDGRAVDQASGQVYEYSTKTNERQWIKTPDGNPVKVDIGKTDYDIDA
ncbi:uncharacterized protein LOC110462257 [Mizuhopecten yessoensis]|nr:uncharacterized protein LOC110462257 [Mizuhopecten yessoensis]